MEQWKEDKLNAIATYLVENILDASVQRQSSETASPFYVFTVTTPKQYHRLGVGRVGEGSAKGTNRFVG
jgi:hypothetical protein